MAMSIRTPTQLTMTQFSHIIFAMNPRVNKRTALKGRLQRSLMCSETAITLNGDIAVDASQLLHRGRCRTC
jgi:hypothetical protein